MPVIPEPMELLELANGQSTTFHVESWELGETVIHPTWPGAPPEKRINVLRVVVPSTDKPLFPHYWDVTSKTLIAQMLPYLQASGFEKKSFTITAHGEAPKKRFTLDIS